MKVVVWLLALVGPAVSILSAQPTWTQALPGTSPSVRVYAAMAYDPVHRQTVLFGGCSTPPSGSACTTAAGSETWLWDGANWSKATPSAFPSARRSHVMAWDAARQRIVLFGGIDLVSDGPDADTWEWDGTTWSQLATSGAPPFSVPSYMAFLPATLSNQLVLLIHGNFLFGQRIPTQTWTLNSSTNAWTRQSVANTTFNLDGGGLVYDPLREMLVFDSTEMLVSGGPRTTGTYLNTGNPENWLIQSPAHAPPPTWNSSYVWAGNVNSFLRFGGFLLGNSGDSNATWEWNGDDWMQATTTGAPPAREGGAIAYDEAHREVVLFGGLSGNSSPVVQLADTWLLSEAATDRWTQATPATTPTATKDFAIAFDPRNLQTVIFGGSGNDAAPHADTWVWDGNDWQKKQPLSSPPPGYWGAMADDGKELILFGGYTSSLGGLSNDTWAWDGTNWTLKSPATRPPARRSAALTYDRAHQRTVLFGGRDSTGNYLSDTWLWDGSNWTQQFPAASPPGEVAVGMAYDEKHQNTVLFNGAIGPSQGSATWIWDGDTWTEQSPAVTPVSRYGVDSITLAYDSLDGRTILFGGSTVYGTALGDTWAWDGTNWSQLSTIGSPPNRNEAKLAYDAARQQTVLFGGIGCGAAYYCADTWLLGPAAPPTTTTVNITVPDGVQFLFNGQSYTGSQTIQIAPGSYTLSTGSPQTLPSGVQALFDSWSGDAAESRQVIVAHTPLSIVGNFHFLYPVTILVPAGVEYVLNGSTLTGTNTTYLAPGSHALSTTSPQNIAAGSIAKFVSWSDGGAQSHSLTVAAVPITLLGNFNLQFLVNTIASPSTGGTVTGGGYYDRGSLVTLTASVNAGFEFDFWSGACTGSGASCSFVIAKASTVTANFSSLLQWYAVFPAVKPSLRTNATMAYDSVRQVTVLFGGQDPQGNLLGDTWEWNGFNWSQRNPANSPPARKWGALAYDAANHQTVLFGGLAASGFRLPDTWLWDGTNWTQKVGRAPSARSSSRMAFDAARNEIVLFGGATSDSTVIGDTWTWNGSAWTQMSPLNSPPGRGAHSLVYDEAHAETVLFGGADGTEFNTFNDTWIWDGNNWMHAAPATSPQPRFHHAAAFDEAAQQVAIFGGSYGDFANTVWFWDGANWAKKSYLICPNDRTETAAAYDAARKQYVLFGGVGSVNPIFPSGYTNDTWLLANNLNPSRFTLMSSRAPANGGSVSEFAVGQPGPSYFVGTPVAVTATPNPGFELETWSGACTTSQPCIATLNSNQSVIANFGPARTWVQQFPAASPAFTFAIAFSSMAYDKVHHQVVLVDESARTWTYDGVNWTLRNPAHQPGVGPNAELVFDEANSQVLLFGQAAAVQTWTWDGVDWTNRSPATQPPPRTTPGLAYDGANGTVVLFGGNNGGFLADTWIWNGATGSWTQVFPAHIPTPRASPSVAYDPVHQNLVMFGGLTAANGITFSLGDTYTWNGSNWAQLPALASPPARDCAAIAWDASHQQMLLFGGDSTGVSRTYLSDTWAWDGVSWTPRSPAQSPNPRACAAMAYDSQNAVPVLFGGFNSVSVFNDTWTYGAASPVRPYTLTTGTIGNGSVARSAPGPSYPLGTTVQLTATPASGYEFEYWSGGGCSGSMPTCSVVMNGDRTAIANFALPVQWVQLNPAKSPVPVQGQFSEYLSMAYDAADSQTVFFGGPYGKGIGNQTWLWDGTNWNQAFPATVPPVRTAAKLAYDPVNHNVVMFGGFTVVNGLVVAYPDTWVWDGSNWTQKAVLSAAPPARFNHGLAFDGQRILLFGGWSGGANVYGDTWTWDGSAWTQRFPAFSPSPRSDFGMAYDAARNQVALFGHFEQQGDTDTWIWDGSTWNRHATATHPPAGWNTMAYDSMRQQTFLITEDLLPGNSTQTWAWDGVNWSLKSSVLSPAPRTGGAMAYDATSRQILLFGGTSSVTGAIISDTWALLGPSVNLVPQAPSVVRDGAGNYLVSVTVKNQGDVPLATISLSTAKLGGVSGTPVTPATLTGINPGQTGSFTVKVPVASVSGHSVPLIFTGTYSTQLTSNAPWTVSVRSVALP